MNIPILYEDNHLLIVTKPVNVPVQEDRSGDPDLLNVLKQDLKVRYNKPGNVFLALVHRLDRPVGGVMVFAKTSKAASRLSDVIRRKKLGRTYLATIRGRPTQQQDTLEHYLLKDTRKNIVRIVSPDTEGAKKAILDYELIASNNADDLSLVKIKLHTGRSHQIRVQMAAIGCPLYGDQRYGQHVNKPGQQIALWAHQLSLPHPTRDELIAEMCVPPLEYPWDLWELSQM